MKKVNWKILNAALWCEVLISYLLPFNVVGDFAYRVGFPIPFLTLYDTKINVNPLTSMHVNPLGFIANGFIIYFVIVLALKLYKNQTHPIR